MDAVYTTRQRCTLLVGALKTSRSTFMSHWRELGEFVKPRRPRFTTADVNRGDRRSQKIIDSTATLADRTLSAGMMSSITSPARPWFRLKTPDADLNDMPAVKEWLYEVNQRMEVAFVRSNLYNALPIVYSDMGTFGTAAVFMADDDEQVFRFYTFPIGSYLIANDAKMRVRTFAREFQWTVDQVVERWGNIDPKTGKPDFESGRPTTISPTVQTHWKNNRRQTMVELVHVIQPNTAYDGQKLESRFKRFESIYYEAGTQGGDNDGLLERAGFDEFPVFCPRWETNSEDVYGTNCPGMTALGDVKELQSERKGIAQAIEKMIKPPMVGPSALRNSTASTIPGGITYVDVRDGMQGFRAAHDVNYGAALGPMAEMTTEVRDRIRSGYFVDLFLMLSQSDRREITAREIDERHEEKLLALGPMLEQLNQDTLDPLIDRGFAIMLRKNLLPPPPPELEGMELHIEYVSIMAQAQKMVGLASLERAAGFVGQVAQYDQSVLDVVDGDELTRAYLDSIGLPPKIVRSEDAVAQLRNARAKAQQAQQAAENAPGLASAARDLSQAPTDGNSILSKIVGGANARRTLNATAVPVQAVA